MPWRLKHRCNDEVRYRGLKGVEAVVKRQECVLAKGDDRLVLDRQHR
jgi:hypothetical protein